jgi:hypothetical protein
MSETAAAGEDAEFEIPQLYKRNRLPGLRFGGRLLLLSGRQRRNGIVRRAPPLPYLPTLRLEDVVFRQHRFENQ